MKTRGGGCKLGATCGRGITHTNTPVVELNFLGFPIRPGEKECTYYMRHRSCKYGSHCRFNHPVESDATTFSMHNQPTKPNFYTQQQQLMVVEEFPHRPHQHECTHFIKTGDCKFRSRCKFHHPKTRIPNETPPCAPLSDKGQAIGKHINSEEDRISALPDDIIVSILSLLTMEEAARSSVLSHRWENMWKYFGGSFEFCSSITECYASAEFFDKERTRYINWVNKVLLKQHQGATMDKLRIYFSLCRWFQPEINSWIAYALEKRVKSLELHFRMIRPAAVSYTLTSTLVSGFGGLKELYLRHLDVTDEVFGSIVCNCPMLEQLCLEDISSLTQVKVICPSLKWKHLKIVWCRNLVNVEISSANLLSFTYDGPKRGIIFESIPRLSALSVTGLCGEFLVSQVQQPSSMILISKLENLVMDIHYMITPRRTKSFPIEFSNLKTLELAIVRYVNPSVLFLTSLIDAAPCLEKFTLKIRYHTSVEVKNRWKATEYSELKNTTSSMRRGTSRYLKVIEIIGFDGHATDFDYAMFLLKKASSLEKLIINPMLRVSETRWWRPTLAGFRLARARAKLLELRLPPGAKLEIL